MSNQSNFKQRIGIDQGQPIENDFPRSARTALAYLFADLANKGFLIDKKRVLLELNRIGRLTNDGSESTGNKNPAFANELANRLYRLNWYQVYSFCERVYINFLMEDPFGFSIQDVQLYFSQEVNTILDEENIAFHFANGQFHRRGKAQTQKAIERVGSVLSNPTLSVVRNYYNKARKFFDQRPNADFENCVKEALCSLEACVEILTGKRASKDFEKSIKQLLGNNDKQIPSPIGEGMIKLHAYRGSGQGVAHAAMQGNRVSSLDAELVLSLTASYITYLSDLYLPKEDVPF
jgi:hypothetical protein